MGSYTSEPQCTRAQPAATSTTAPAYLEGRKRSYNAQCVPLDSPHPCQEHLAIGEGAIRDWLFYLDEASELQGALDYGGIDGTSSRDPDAKLERFERYRKAWDDNQDCQQFAAWTALGILQLCRGDDALRHPMEWENFERRLIKSTRDDLCRIRAVQVCAGALENSVSSGKPTSRASFEMLLEVCPEGLPFGAPCQGPDGISCVQARLWDIAQSLSIWD